MNIDKNSSNSARKEVSEIDGTAYLLEGDGEIEEASIGDIVCDSRWDVEYLIDSSAKNISAALDHEQRRREDLQTKNKQILEVKLRDTNMAAELRKSYLAIADRGEDKYEEAGFIAEKIVMNLLQRIVFEAGLPLEIIEATVEEDVEGKIDFILKRTDNGKTIGIQFYVNPKPAQREYKRAQIMEANAKAATWGVEQIQPVSVRMPKIKQLLQEWRENGMKSGGPESLLKDSIQSKITQQAFGEILTDAEMKRVQNVMK